MIEIPPPPFSPVFKHLLDLLLSSMQPLKFIIICSVDLRIQKAFTLPLAI